LRKKLYFYEGKLETQLYSISHPNSPFTRNQRASSLSEQNKSTLTDHASHDKHAINWPAATIFDRESDKGTRWIKQAVYIRKEGQQSLNQDEGSYTLSHMYDFLPRRIIIVARTERSTEQASSDEGLGYRPKCQGKTCWLC